MKKIPVRQFPFYQAPLTALVFASSATSLVQAATLNTPNNVWTLTQANPSLVNSSGDPDIFIGSAGTGDLTITGFGDAATPKQGLVSGYDSFYVGYSTGSTDGIGRLTINNGASVTLGYNTLIGYAEGGNGTGSLTVDNGASLATYILYVGGNNGGGDGNGTLLVTRGSSVSAQSINIGIGYGGGGSATGSMTVDQNSSVTSVDTVFIGTDSPGSGTLLVTNGSQMHTDGSFIIGRVSGGTEASGTLTVNNGAAITAGNIIEVDNGAFNIGGAKGQAAVAAGSVTATSVALETHSSQNRSGEINFNHTDSNYTFAPGIIGTGSVNLLSGNTIFTGNNTYNGTTTIGDDSATLTAGSATALSANSDYVVTRDGTLDLNGFSQTVASLNNAGNVLFNRAANSVGTSLTVNGDYTGQGGTMVFNGTLAGDGSMVDTLHVIGNTSGTTNVKVNNLGGTGAKTVEGIELITVGGLSDGSFVQNGRIVAGAYDYSLVKGGLGGVPNNWYLTSAATPTNPATPVEPSTPAVSLTRPEAGSYMSNLAASQEMFITRLEDRGGDRVYTDPITGIQKTTSLWLRTTGNHLDTRDSSNQLKTDENRYVVQLGGDVVSGSFTGTDSWHLGLMGGYGNSRSDTHSSLSGYRSKGNVDGYSTGAYLTWFQNADRNTGAYIDSWLQYAWYSNHIQGEGLSGERYDSSGLQASLESGYTFWVGGGKTQNFFLQPQAQVMWNGVEMDSHRETNGTRVEGQGENNVQTRLGAKIFVEARNVGNAATWKPYVSGNWLHLSKTTGVSMDDVSIYAAGQKNLGEAKLGLEAEFNSNLKIGTSAVARFGDNSYRDVGGIVNVRFGF